MRTPFKATGKLGIVPLQNAIYFECIVECNGKEVYNGGSTVEANSWYYSLCMEGERPKYHHTKHDPVIKGVTEEHLSNEMIVAALLKPHPPIIQTIYRRILSGAQMDDAEMVAASAQYPQYFSQILTKQ